MTAAEELGRRETMDDGQGLEKGKLEERGVKGGAHLCSGLVGGLKLRVREGWRAGAARAGRLGGRLTVVGAAAAGAGALA